MLVRPRSCPHSLLRRRLPPPIRLARPIHDSHRLLTTLTTLPNSRPCRQRPVLRSGVVVLPARRLATAVEYGATDDSLPPPPTAARPLWELRPHNVTMPLVVSEEEGPTAVRQKINTRGVPGDLDEMMSVVDACLEVGKLDRAALVLKRLGRVEIVGGGLELVQLQNRYLRAVVEQLQATPSTTVAEDLHKWYELEIRGRLGQQTPETIAYMLKASLLTARGVRQERLIDRYMSMVPGDAGLEVLHMSAILNDQDRAAITAICHTYNLEPDLANVFAAPESSSPDETLFESALRSITPEAAAELAETAATTTSEAAETTETAQTATAAEETLANMPEVLGTPQKGMGLRVLKQTLSLFSEIPQGRDIGELGLEEQREIQSRLERDCVSAAIDRWRVENEELLKMGLNTSLGMATLNARLFEWHRDLRLRLAQELKKIEVSEAAKSKNKEDLDRCVYGPFLRQSDTSRLAAVTIVSTLSCLALQGADKGASMGNAITQIAKVAEEDIRLQVQAKQLAAQGKKAASRAAKTAMRRVMRSPKSGALDMEDPTATDPTAATYPDIPILTPDTPARELAWPITIKAKVGAVLLAMLMETAKVTAVRFDEATRTLLSQEQPAFSRLNQLKKGKKVGMLTANTMLVELMKREPRGDFLARHLPMVAEPAPWTGFSRGGFLEYPAPLVRIKDSRKDQQMYAEAAIARGDMDQVLRGLDVLGRTAWKVNRPVFAVMLEAWNTGEEIADIPPLHPDIAIPAEPDSSADPMQRRVWLKAVKAAENQRSGLHSVRCFANFQMEIARAFRDQTFYFPHNVDFRGRAYPIPPYFNHMGADNVRGLLTFAQGKPLGARGLQWLQVHLANVYGYDKASLAERAAFAVAHLDDIRDAAAHPLDGRRWWLTAEDPWQCLAACFELAAAHALDDPTQYASHLPVHQDGTCNGLQHYAALGGDTWGARQVNLEPGDRPADVYSAVADIVKAHMVEDAARGDANAIALEGRIKRKVVKQTVMTNVYGVTYSGARKQVLRQLDALYPTLQAETGVAPMMLASYIATKIFHALSTMFGGAHDIQHWLGEVGGRVCRALTPDQVATIIGDAAMEVEDEAAADETAKTGKAGRTKAKKRGRLSTKQNDDDILAQFRSTLVWTTPLQMPVVQPYRKTASRTIETCLQDLILSVPEGADPVHKRKQLQAFPPNFIHSLDASHMLLSALECDALGLSFAAVHDSFWTHAADVDTMNRVLRDAFVRIHSEDVVGRLAAEFEARYRGSIYLAQLNRTSTAAQRVLAWRKTHRLSLRDELALEKRRLDLLQSDDADDVARGRRMVTPGSLFDATTHEEAAAAAADAKDATAAAADATRAIEAALEAEDVSEFRLGSIPTGPRRQTAASGAASNEDDLEADADANADAEVDGNAAAFDDVEDVETHEAGEADLEAGAADPDALSEADVAIAVAGGFEARLKNLPKTKVKKAAPRLIPVQIWMPLTFPPIPAKGDFDVRRLRDSDYFFS